MATSAVSSHGTLLKVGDGTPTTEVFATIGEVKDISGPSTTVNMEAVTSHDSNGWVEQIPTLKEAGEVSFDINYHGGTTQTSLRTDMENRTLRNFQMVLPTDPEETLAFSGYVTSWEYGAPVDGILTASLSIKLTGPVTSTTAP